jgi:hypothetical protein
MRVTRHLRKPIRKLTVSSLWHLPRPVKCCLCTLHLFFGGADGV